MMEPSLWNYMEAIGETITFQLLHLSFLRVDYKLSGGEKQRAALAHAFLKRRTIAMCDEATSALDSTTEADILASLKSLASNRNSIFAAHRCTTAMQCDEIVVLENGKVVEQGHHEILLSKSGRYAQLRAQQNKGSDAVDVADK